MDRGLVSSLCISCLLTSLESTNIVAVFFVRSVISISLMIALLCSQMPVQAQMECHHMRPTMCHRAAKAIHDCGMMHDEQAADDKESSRAPQTPGANVKAVESGSKCPMTCCFQFGARAVAVIRVAGNYFQQAIVPLYFP
jgi:hypothetical protein